jgi:signal transduction histidine kinase
MIERQVNHIVRLIDDLLDVSRISEDRIRLRTERVAFADIVEAAVEGVRPLIEAAGHTLVLDMPREPIDLEADPVRLTQVLLNLLNNATKYTEPGGRIDLIARADGEVLVVRVKDNGIGIPAEMRSQIFEMFAQAGHARSRAQGGLGIGLSLVECLVRLHGGSVEVDSAGPDQGSEFIVRLPRCAPRAVDLAS